MRLKSGIIWLALVALGWSTGCGGPRRIAKLPVPQEDVIRSYRLLGEGDLLLEEGKEHLALLKYLEASEVNPYSEIVFNKLAIAYSRLQMFPQARRAANRALGLNPRYAFAYNTSGIVHLGEGNPGKAVSDLRRALQFLPDAANFHVNLGFAYMQARRYEEGLAAYQRALELDPQILQKEGGIQVPAADPGSSDPERYYQMARFFASLGDKDSCLHYLRLALDAGFTDMPRLMGEDAFDRLRQDQDFLQLLAMYGLPTGSS